MRIVKVVYFDVRFLLEIKNKSQGCEMNKNIIVLLIALSLIACGGGGGGTDTATTPAASTVVPAGIYEGTVTPAGGAAESAVALITSNGKAAIVDTDTVEGFIGTISGDSLTGTMYSTSSVPSTAKVTSVSGNNISGTYTSSIGGGTFSLVANPNLYNKTSKLSKLAGVWVDSVFTNVTGISTWTVQNDGTFTISSTSGCTAIGSFAIFNTAKNEYNLSLNISNCPGMNGVYSGFAIISDSFNADDTISLVFANGSIGGISEPIKQ